eukprot:626085-Prorocentrum_minimum.AAC.1
MSNTSGPSTPFVLHPMEDQMSPGLFSPSTPPAINGTRSTRTRSPLSTLSSNYSNADANLSTPKPEKVSRMSPLSMSSGPSTPAAVRSRLSPLGSPSTPVGSGLRAEKSAPGSLGRAASAMRRPRRSPEAEER